MSTDLSWSLWVSVVVCGCLALSPPASVASTVALADRTAVDYGHGWGGIDYFAAPGEANRVVLTQRDDLTIRVIDSGAVIDPRRGCSPVDAHTADCSLAGMPGWNGLIAANVRAGDRDDFVDSQGPGLSADGGPGNDTLQSSSGASGILNGGGGGRDVLLGGSNRDTLIDGDTSGSADSDVLDGRGEEAIVSYASRTAPIFANLADPSSAGEAGERDELRSVSGIMGGRGDDNLRGDNRPNLIDGGPGADRLRGGRGDDSIDGDTGADQLSGQAGDDFLFGGPGRDTASGGPGRDIVSGGVGRDRLEGGSGADYLASGAASCGRGEDEVTPSAGDYVARDCETARFALHIRRDEIVDEKGIRLDPHAVRQDAASVTLRVQCPYTETDGYPSPLAMRGSVRITGANGRLFGYAAVPLAGRRCATSTGIESASELPWVRIRVPLTPAGRGALSAPRTSLARIAFTGRNVPPVPWRVDWRL